MPEPDALTISLQGIKIPRIPVGTGIDALPLVAAALLTRPLNEALPAASVQKKVWPTPAYARKSFYEGVIPGGDAFATATAFTGMWLMAKKKVESWYWWIATNITSIPLYYIKGYVLTSVYYFVLLILALFGLIEWQRRARAVRQSFKFETQ